MTIAVTRTADHNIAVATLMTAPGDGGIPLPSWLATSAGVETGLVGAPLYVAPGTGATWAITAASLPLPSGAATSAKQDTGNASLSSIDGKLPALGQALAAASVPVVLTAAQLSTLTPLSTVAATQSGSWSVAVSSMPTTTVTGPLTDAQLRASAVPVSVATVPSHDVTNAGTFSVQVSSSALPTGAATAAKQPAIGTAGTASADVLTVQGIASMTPLKVDGSAVTQPVSGTVAATQSGAWSVTVASAPTTAVTGPLTDSELRASAVAVSDGGGSITVDGSVSVTGAVAVTDNSGSLTVDAPVGTPVFVRLSDGAAAITTLPVSLASVPSHAVTNAGTFAVQETGATAVVGNGTAATAQRVTLASDSTGIVALTTSTASIGKLAANSGVTIGAVEIAATQTLSTVTTVGTLTGGGVAHDGADSGNPVKVGAKAVSTLATATMVSAADRTDATSDLDGAILTRNQFPLGDLTSERVTDTGGTSTAFSNFGATASTRNYITAIGVFNSSTTSGYIDFRDGTGGSVLWTLPIPAGGGAVIACDVPLFRTSANTALAYDVSAALSTVYISVSGFRSKV